MAMTPHVPVNQSAPVASTTPGAENEAYDFSGAMYFTVAVVLVYGLSIVALITTHMRGEGREIREESRQITQFMRDKDEMRRKGEQERLMWLQEELGFRSLAPGGDHSTSPRYKHHRNISRGTNLSPTVSELSLISETEAEETFPAGVDQIDSLAPFIEKYMKILKSMHKEEINDQNDRKIAKDLPVKVSSDCQTVGVDEIDENRNPVHTRPYQTEVGVQTRDTVQMLDNKSPVQSLSNLTCDVYYLDIPEHNSGEEDDVWQLRAELQQHFRS